MDEIKTVLTALLIIAVVVVAYFAFASPVQEQPVSKEVFLQTLAEAQKVFIIMDLRNASNGTIRNNIMQCGVDFAGSNGLVDKNITAFALEGESCTGISAIKTAKSCLDESKSGVSIVITENINTTTYYTYKTIVKIGADYKTGTCSIKKVE